ncbi:MAG TPA: outer membrane protein assembly factor BamA [Anaerolineae bacterium]|nr:outer membrane protein assembly factor BamA [Anaerolineae bacterium]
MKYITTLLFVLIVFLFSTAVLAQSSNRIQEIVVESNIPIPESLILTQSGLKVGSALSSDITSEAIKKLWHLGFFSDVQILREQIENGVKVIIRVTVDPSVTSIKTSGFKEFEESEILNTIKLVRGMTIGERKIAKMKNQILDMYKQKGFLLAHIDFDVTPLPEDSTKVNVIITVNEGKKVKIKSITLIGNQNISDKKIKKEMETKEDRWYRSGEYKEDVLEEDKKKIVALYKTQGFRDAFVLRDSLSYDEGSDKVNLAIFLEEGKQYKFGTNSFEGNIFFKGEDLLTHVKYEEGDTFNEGLIEFARYGMMNDYHNNGYLAAAIQAIQYAHSDTVDILYDIAESNVSKVSKVIIEGNTKTRENVIRREISLLPGEIFNREKLERSQRDIQALNFFQKVDYNFEPAEEENDVNVKFKVEEKQTGIASMGAGYSERDRLVGTLAFSNSNLFGKGQSIGFNMDMGSRREAFQVQFTEPWLFNTPTIFSFNVYNIMSSDYTTAFDTEKRRGGYVRLGRKLKWPDDYCRAYVSYRLEDTDYTNPSIDYQYYLMTGKTSSLSFIFMRDSRDLPQFATKGTYSSATMEIAGGPLGGDLSYYKYLLHNELYSPLFWKLSFVTRTRLGFLRGYKENTFVPYSERFMPGGISFDGIVRGYPNRQVCPRLRGEEIGGETMFVTNIEMQVPIVAQMVYGIGFYDFGNSWASLSETNPFDLKRSAGVGVRLYIPQIGLVGFDFGYGFDKLDGATKIGGWRTHFQFGNMF